MEKLYEWSTWTDQPQAANPSLSLFLLLGLLWAREALEVLFTGLYIIILKCYNDNIVIILYFIDTTLHL